MSAAVPPSSADDADSIAARRPARWIAQATRFAAAAVVGAIITLALPSLLRVPDGDATGGKRSERDGTRSFSVAGGRIDVIYRAADFQVTPVAIARWLRQSAIATSTYFGRFPVKRVVIRLRAVDGNDIVSGSATADPDPRITITIGRSTSESTLLADSTAVHEMTHLAIPDHAESYLWFHEGIATYVETIARAQAGHITQERAWAELVHGMSSGVAEEDDERGLDNTEVWDRRYWGGAIFFLMADIEIRRRTANKYGLQDALRHLQSAGGTLATHWQFERILTTADDGVGADVLRTLYRKLARNDAPGRIDSDALERLWRELGVVPSGWRRSVQLDDKAPIAGIRRSITSKPSAPLLISAPRQVGEGRSRQARTLGWPVFNRAHERAHDAVR